MLVTKIKPLLWGTLLLAVIILAAWIGMLVWAYSQVDSKASDDERSKQLRDILTKPGTARSLLYVCLALSGITIVFSLVSIILSFIALAKSNDQQTGIVKVGVLSTITAGIPVINIIAIIGVLVSIKRAGNLGFNNYSDAGY